VFVSDNAAYDWHWIAGLFDVAGISNPLGQRGRRVSDFYAGLTGKWSNTQTWKKWRVTTHDHNPVNDAMGNVEAFAKILTDYGSSRPLQSIQSPGRGFTWVLGATGRALKQVLIHDGNVESLARLRRGDQTERPRYRTVPSQSSSVRKLN
jgi:hypothetical protein